MLEHLTSHTQSPTSKRYSNSRLYPELSVSQSMLRSFHLRGHVLANPIAIDFYIAVNVSCGGTPRNYVSSDTHFSNDMSIHCGKLSCLKTRTLSVINERKHILRMREVIFPSPLSIPALGLISNIAHWQEQFLP